MELADLFELQKQKNIAKDAVAKAKALAEASTAQVAEMQVIEDMDLLKTEMMEQKKADAAQFELLFMTFRSNGYEELWPGVTGPEAEARAKLPPLFFSC